jgi:hypothetical protein
MKLSGFQKYLRALADAIGGDKSPAKDLSRAADALIPFADSTMDEFARFLELAAEKYKATGDLPDGGKQTTTTKAVRPRAARKRKPGDPTPAQFAARIEELKAALDRGEQFTRDQVASDLAKYKESLTQVEIDSVISGLKFSIKYRTKGPAMEAIVTHILAARSATDRVKI